MKKLLKLGAMATLLAAPAAAQAAIGDVNGSGSADIDDLNIIINQMLGTDTGFDCDVDGNGAVDVDDLNLEINIMLGRVPEQPGVTPVDETFTVEDVTFKMIYVEGGTFTMGGGSRILEMDEYAAYRSSQESQLEMSLPAHEVTLTSYKIMETEMVQQLFYALMGSDADMDPDNYYYRSYTAQLNPVMPVDYCSWDLAMEFASRLSSATGRTFRLPTEAEWEYAARGGKKSQGYIFIGGDNVYQVGNVHNANYYQNDNKVPKSFLPNELGLYDMAGNVAEWCLDEGVRYYTEDAQTDPQIAAGEMVRNSRSTSRVSRGGCSSDFPLVHTRCTLVGRSWNDQTTRTFGLGFRLVLVD